MTCGIYAIINKINGKRYIGQSIRIEKRWYDEKKFIKTNNHLTRSFKKYGLNNFDFIILKKCKKEELNELEELYIWLFKSYIPEFGYNQTLGGYSGYPTDEIRLKISKKLKGKKCWNTGLTKESDERLLDISKKISKKLKGKPFTEEHKKNISKGKLGLHMSFKSDGRSNWTKERNKKSHWWTNGNINKFCEVCPNGFFAGHTVRKILCIDTGQIFLTMKDASKWAGVSNIGNLRKKDQIEWQAGFHPDTKEVLTWKYC